MNLFEKKQYLGVFIYRIFLSLQILYGVQDNILSWSRMLAFRDYLLSQGFPIPLTSALASVYSQLAACLLLLIGFKTKPAAAVLVFHFMIAVGVHIRAGDEFSAMLPALNILFGCLLFLFHGAGRPSVEQTN
jgi:putative oxidoreductase